MLSNIRQFLPLDTHGTTTANLPIIKQFPAAKLASLVITFDDDGSALQGYLQYWEGEYNVHVAAGATAAVAPGFMPFYNSGQLVGVLISIRAAAEYESLVSQEYHCCVGISGASSTMLSLSISHFLIIGMVVFSNAVYFLGRRTSKKATSP